jgi:hypothetical protein
MNRVGRVGHPFGKGRPEVELAPGVADLLRRQRTGVPPGPKPPLRSNGQVAVALDGGTDIRGCAILTQRVSLRGPKMPASYLTDSTPAPENDPPAARPMRARRRIPGSQVKPETTVEAGGKTPQPPRVIFASPPPEDVVEDSQNEGCNI